MRSLFLVLAAGLIAVLATSATLFSCDHVKGTGEVVKKSITVEAFHGIVVEGSMDVIVTRSTEPSVTIEAQPNIADLVTITVKNGVWRIGTSKGYSTSKPFTVHISTPEMDLVHIEGSGNVKSAGTFDVEEASLAIAGSGDITMNYHAASIKATVDGSGSLHLSGACDRMKMAIAGSGDIKAAGLAVKDLDVDIAGSGDVSATASGDVDVDIAGSGDVVLASAPAKMNKRIAGSGSVHIAH